MPYQGTYKVTNHTRFNDGTSSDLSQSLAQHPGWLLGIQAFSISSVGICSLFVFDTAVAVTTAMTPLWQGVVPYAQVATASNAAGGAGFLLDMSQGITLNNGLAYAISSGNTVAALSTMPASQIKVNLQYVTSSCL
jgi:hypothetical protein